MYASLPPKVIYQMSPIVESEIHRWWAALDAETREDIERMYASEKDNEVFVEFSARAIGEPVEPTEDEIWVEEVTDLLEYYNNHEMKHHAAHFHIGGICSQHVQAKAICRKGVLPAAFVCPLENATCPMAHIQSHFPKKDVRFFLKFGLRPKVEGEVGDIHISA